MKGKFLNTKNVVIGLVSLVLIGASATGVTIFLKNRGQAEAAGEQVQNLPATGREEQDNNQTNTNPGTAEDPNNQGNNTEVPGTPVEPTTPNTNPGTTTPNQTTGGTTTNPSGNNTTTGIEETVRIERQKVFEDLQLSWTTIGIPAITANMGIFKPELQIEKTATAVIREGEAEQIPVIKENKPMVRAGDTIIYTIQVSNLGNYKATNVVVTDSLDVIFDGKTVLANEELAKIETLEAGKVATLKVGYVVKQEDIDAVLETEQNEIISKDIINIATATDGKTTVEDDDDMPVNPDVTISGTKTWIDNENLYETRPESITINVIAENKIVAKQEVKPDAEGNWTYTFTNLPKYDENKNEIVYSISEKELGNYTYQISEKGYDIKNTIAQDSTVTVEGSKTWITPVEDLSTLTATIELYRDGVKVEGKTTTVRGNGTYKFENLEKYDLTDGHEYVYTVKEVKVEGYTTEQTGNNFKNTIAQDSTVTVEGSKTWITPVEDLSTLTATIELYRDGVKVEGKTTTVRGNGTYKFENLEKYDLTDGHEYVYTVKEIKVEGYTTEQTGNNFTNTISQKYINLTGTKRWLDPEGTEHEDVIIQLQQDGNPYTVNGVTYEVTLKDGTTSFEFLNLPKYKIENGKVKEYEYTVKEIKGQTGYTVSYGDVTEQNDGNLVQNITNSLEQTEINFTANKVWIDEGTTDSRTTITVELWKNGVKTNQTKTISKGQTSCKFTGLERYTIITDEDGEVISYTENKYEVKEKDVTGYTPSYGNVEKSGTEWSQTITNTIDQDTIDIPVEKKWNTANGIVKPTITFTLKMNGKTYNKEDGTPYTITLENGTLKGTFTNLPKYKQADGKLVVKNGKVERNEYTVEEEALSGYTSESKYENGKYTFTNTANGIVKVTKHSTTATTDTVPVDVVLMLDVSGSMLNNNGKDKEPQSRAENMVSAVNSAISTIMAKNQNNRVSVVAFSSTNKDNDRDSYAYTNTIVLLPLAHYPTRNEYLSYSDDDDWDWKYTNYGGDWRYTEVNSAKISVIGTNKEISVTGGTYTQTGIYEGAMQLINTSDVTYTKGEGYDTVTRIPIMMLLTDGLPTYASTTWNAKPTDKANASGNNSGSNTSADEAYYTIRTAKYFKGKVGEHYNNTDAKFYTIGFGVDSNDKLANAILNPTETNINNCGKRNAGQTENNLYNNIGTPKGQYSYADGSYIGSMDTGTLTDIMNSFINANSKVTEERVMTETELTGKIINLDNIDIEKEFKISYETADGTTEYNFTEAVATGLVKTNDNGVTYYVDLNGVNITGQIIIAYNEKTVNA